MRTTFGVFKENYQGYSIYWAGKFNIEGGEHEYRTLAEARVAIKEQIKTREEAERLRADRKISEGAIAAYVNKESSVVTVKYPDGLTEIMPLRKFRQQVFDIEDTWGSEVVYTETPIT